MTDWQHNFGALCRIEPRLLSLLGDALKLDKAIQGHVRWYGRGGMKASLVKLVGREAENPYLRSEACWTTAKETVWGAMPSAKGERVAT